MLKRRYSVSVTTTTTQRYQIIAVTDEQVEDTWNVAPEMFQVIGQPITTETLNINQSVPFVEGQR